jgi:hypothetical protein
MDHLIRWNAAKNVVSYLQDCSKPLQELEDCLRTGNFGDSPESIIMFCKQISELDQQMSKQERISLWEKVEVSRKKWEKLCRVGRDSRLSKYSPNLPTTFTAIYALTMLTNDELNDGMMTGDLNPTISSRKIYTYAQEFRLYQTAFSEEYKNIMPCFLAIGDKGKDLKKWEIDILFRAVNQTLVKSGVMILAQVSPTKKFNQKQKELIAKEKRQGTIEMEIEHQMYMVVDGLYEYYTSMDVYEILNDSMSQFARALMLISKTRLEMMEKYGRLYCYKIALEFNRTNNRVQRFNYKRRLLHVQQKYKFLSPVVEHIFSEFVKRPKTFK